MMVAGPINVLIAALTAEAQTKTVLRSQATASVAYVVCGSLAVVAIGPVGLAAGLVLSRWLWAAVLFSRTRRHLGIRFPRGAAVSLGCGLFLYGGLLVSSHAGTLAVVITAPVALVIWTVLCWDLVLTSFRRALSA